MDHSLYVSSSDPHHPLSDGAVHPNPYNNHVFQAPPPPPPHPSFNHPPYFQMISMAIAASNEPDGLSKEAISRYIVRNYTGLPPDHDALLTRHLKTLKNSRIVQVKKSYKFAASPDPCLEVPRSKNQHPLDLTDVSASQPQKRGGHGGPSNLQPSWDELPLTKRTEEIQKSTKRRPGRPTKRRAALVMTESSGTVDQQRERPPNIGGLRKDSEDEKEDTIISLSSNSSESADGSDTLNSRKKGKLVEDGEAMISNTSCSVKRRKLEPKIKNPEKYLKNPENIYFETKLKNRPYELLIDAKVVKTHSLKFNECIHYIDSGGKVQSETMKTKDRVCIRYWNRICERNNLKKEDRVLCELLREGDMVYAINVHVVRGKDL